MTVEKLPYPAGAVRCARGDHLVHLEGGRWRVYRVEDVVAFRRMAPFGPDQTIEEVQLLDSRAPAYHGELHLLLTGFARDFADPDAAARAVAQADFGAATEGLHRRLDSFAAAETRVVPAAAP